MSESNSKLSVRSVSKRFVRGKGATLTALAPTSFDVVSNEVFCLMGPSGCGKSTLLNVIAGLLEPTEGVVVMDGKPVSAPGPDRAMVFQSDAVFPWMRVSRNVGYAPRVAGKSRAEREEIASRFIRMVGLEEFRDSWPKELSGGMRKRVDLARAFAANPEVVLMDEPFGALDVMTKEGLQVELESLLVSEPKTVVFVTHDVEEALFLGDRVALMSSRPGRIVEIIDVPFPHPRVAEQKTSPDFVDLRRRVLAHFQHDLEGTSRMQVAS